MKKYEKSDKNDEQETTTNSHSNVSESDNNISSISDNKMTSSGSYSIVGTGIMFGVAIIAAMVETVKEHLRKRNHEKLFKIMEETKNMPNDISRNDTKKSSSRNSQKNN
ncbi:MAG: hypothetical protein IJ644_01775 [Oscillospiraceae bacterium]|nr:hypothetical protein [Oscillospiraceae bacterium]